MSTTSTEKAQPQLVAENMAEMELKEIVKESCSLMNKWKRQLLPFFICLYIPVAVMYTIHIRLQHERVEKIFHAFVIALKQQQQQQVPDPTTPPVEPAVSNTQVVLEYILLVAYAIGVYHMVTSTILTLSTLHQSATRADLEEDQSVEFSAKKIVAMLPSRTWRVFMTDVVCFFAYVGIFLLMLLAILIVVGLAQTVMDLEVAYISLILEVYLFTVWIFYFLLNITLARQVSAVERLWGWAAIKRSGILLRGKKMTAISVLLFLTACTYVMFIVQVTLMLGPRWTVPIGFALNIGLTTVLFWFSISTTTVLYFSCKAAHMERGLALPSFSGKSGPRAVYEPLSST